MITAWIISTKSRGTSVNNSIVAPPLRSAPNSSAAISTPNGELRPRRAIVTPSNPKPREKLATKRW